MTVTVDGTLGITTPAQFLTSAALGAATAGEMEWDGKVGYFTPQSTERGVIPGMQYYRLNSNLTLTATTNAQNILGVGVSLSANTVYAFQALFAYTKTLSATSHNVSIGFGGTATTNNIAYDAVTKVSTSAFTASAANDTQTTFIQTAAATSLNTLASAVIYLMWKFNGTVSINAGGTFIPQITTSVTVGPYTTVAGSYFLIYPIGASGANVSVGTWA